LEHDVHEVAAMRRSLRARARARAFTLVELMTVVIIVGVLATIGIVAFRQQLLGSRSTQAVAMIQSIRAAEERWKSENLRYLDVSTGTAWYPADPRKDSKRIERSFHTAVGAHIDEAKWKALNPTVTGPTEFGFLVNAGGPDDAMTAPAIIPPGFTSWPANGEHWYVIQAIADVNHNGIPAYFLASSLNGEVLRLNEHE
jgi:prepilin-type N-terminal cleavage/methylation domain-containing protein